MKLTKSPTESAFFVLLIAHRVVGVSGRQGDGYAGRDLAPNCEDHEQNQQF